MAGHWRDGEERHINVLEMVALSNALTQLHISDATVHPRIDNTSVVGAARKGWSKSEDLNTALQVVQREAAKKRLQLTNPVFVKSADNIADYWSRLAKR